MDLSSFERRLAAVRVSASAADGQARAVVDGTGRLVGLELLPDLLHGPAEAVAEAILAAVNEAQDSARRADHPILSDVGESMRQRIADDFHEAQAAAERHLAEFNTFLSDLMQRRGEAPGG